MRHRATIAPVTIEAPISFPEPESPPPPLPNVACGADSHLTGTVSSRVSPTSYAIVDHVDGSMAHVTSVRTTVAGDLPEAGDRVEVWGVIRCEGPRYHIAETRRTRSPY